MHIKLIAPAVTKRPMDSAWKTHMAPPLALLVVGALTPEDHRVEVVDECVQPLRTDDSPDLVGITVKADTFGRACRIATAYRRRGIRVVFGGIHPTACPEGCAPHADAVVVGEAERLWPQVLRDAARGSLAPLYRNASPVDPSETPIPRWELLDARRYLFTNTLTAGRGCPWRCAFCYNSSPNLDARHRMKSVPQVLAEIASLGTRHVMFIDDNFIGDPARARALVAAMAPLGLTWHTAVSSDIGRHDDILDAMAASGCKSLFIGFESVRAGNLSACRKVQNRVDDYAETIAKIHARGMLVNASLVFGFDEDTPDVFAETLDWLFRVRPSTMTGHILTPYPGTVLHALLRAQGRIFDHDLEHYNTSRCVFRPKHMTPDELEQGYRWIYERFYSWDGIWKRLPADRRQMAAYLQFNLLYRKFGHAASRFGLLFGMRPLARLATWLAYGGGERTRGARRHYASAPSPCGAVR